MPPASQWVCIGLIFSCGPAFLKLLCNSLAPFTNAARVRRAECEYTLVSPASPVRFEVCPGSAGVRLNSPSPLFLQGESSRNSLTLRQRVVFICFNGRQETPLLLLHLERLQDGKSPVAGHIYEGATY